MLDSVHLIVSLGLWWCPRITANKMRNVGVVSKYNLPCEKFSKSIESESRNGVTIGNFHHCTSKGFGIAPGIYDKLAEWLFGLKRWRNIIEKELSFLFECHCW